MCRLRGRLYERPLPRSKSLPKPDPREVRQLGVEMRKKCKRVVREARLPNLPVLDDELNKWRIRILMQAQYLDTVDQINAFNVSMVTLVGAMKHDQHSKALIGTVIKIMRQAIQRHEHGITPYIDTRGKKYVSQVSAWLETWIAQGRVTMRTLAESEAYVKSMEISKRESLDK